MEKLVEELINILKHNGFSNAEAVEGEEGVIGIEKNGMTYFLTIDVA